MQHVFRAGFFVALAAPFATIAFAQPPIVPPLRYAIPIPPPLIQVESIDAAAKTVTLSEIKFGADRKPIPSAPFTVPLAANAKVLGFETGASAKQLKVGNLVTLLGQKAPEGQVPNLTTRDAQGFERPLPPDLLRILGRTGSMQSGSRASEFEVVAIAPQLILRRGGEPKDKNRDAGFLRTPFSNGGDGKSVGYLSLTEAENGVGTVATLLLTDTKNLEFERFLPVELAAIAASHAAGRVYIKTELGTAPDGKREVTRLVASDIVTATR